MTEFQIDSFVTNLMYFVLALAVLRAMLKYVDWSLGISFKKDVWDVLAKDPRALSAYHGVRFAALVYFAANFFR